MKSYAAFLQGLYQDILSECLDTFPTLRKDFKRDEKRLLSLIESRGLPFMMIDLPTMGKHFDKCLSIGHLTPSGITGFGVFKRGLTIPRLFKGLWRRVFDDSGCLLSDPDVKAIRFLRQLLMLAKKFDMPCPESSNWKSIDDFFKIDREIRRPSLLWDDDDPIIDRLSRLHFGDAIVHDARPLELFPDDRVPIPEIGSSDAETLQRVCDIIAARLGRFDPSDWLGKHGPGAVSDQRRTQFKYDFPNWPEKLESVFHASEHAFANYDAWLYHLNGDGSDNTLLSVHEPPSRLIVVPKTLKGPRLIAAEPVSHQWAQQSLLAFFADRIKESLLSSSINLKRQELNGLLALEASRTESHLTMDLSSASDRLSCWVVERVFRASPSILEALHASRTRWVSNTIDRKSPKYSRIRKFACMGSACTFPVQSIVFACISIASVLVTRSIPVNIKSVTRAAKEVQVFGDDIIVPIDCMERIQGYMDYLGLEVNQSKTFGTGKFRESCGIDAYDGHDVTPVYVRAYPEWSRPESVASSVSSHNNFFLRGYHRAAQRIKSTLPEHRVKPIPEVPAYSGVFGYYSYAPGRPPRKRWNALLQRREYLALTLTSVATKILPKTNSVLLQYFHVAQSAVEFLLGDRLGITQKPRTKLRARWVDEVMFS